MPQSSNLETDELHLSELLAVMWAHKTLIVLITALSVFVGGYYTANIQPVFSAKAIFKLEEDNKSGFNLVGELGNLASIAGLPGNSTASSSAVLMERIVGREFILNVGKNSSLFEDPYFNTFDPKYEAPLWKARLKNFLGWQQLI